MSDPLTAVSGAAGSLFDMIATVAARDPEAQRIGAETRQKVAVARQARRDRVLTSAEREKATKDERRRVRRLHGLVGRWLDALEDGHVDKAERIAIAIMRTGADDDEITAAHESHQALAAIAAELV